MFENIAKFFKKLVKAEQKEDNSKDTAKERLHLVLMQDRANVSVDFLELMKQEIIDVIKKYIDVDENAIDVRLTNKSNDDGTNGAPALYANIPIINMKQEVKKTTHPVKEEEKKIEPKKEEKTEVEKKQEEKEQKIIEQKVQEIIIQEPESDKKIIIQEPESDKEIEKKEEQPKEEKKEVGEEEKEEVVSETNN